LIFSTKLPVDEQPLFRTTEIFEIFRSRLEHLTLALGALQDPNDPNTLKPEVKELLVPLRQLAAEQVSDMATLMRLIREYSTSLIQLVNASPLTDAGEGISDALKSVIDNANTTSGLLAQAKREMDRFSLEVKSSAKQISTVLDNGEQSVQLNL
jgi:ABC-type transporter Mla subunit MlaD